MIKFLASMRFAFISILLMILWFWIGAFIATFDANTKVFRIMNHEMIIDWLFTTALSNYVVLFWFVIFCVIAAFLTLSILLCTYTNLYKRLLNKLNYKNLVLFLIHVVFIVIVVFHVLSVLVGFKHGDIELFEGESFICKNQYVIEIHEIIYVDDLNLLNDRGKKSRKGLTKDIFRYKENVVNVKITHNNNNELISKNLHILNPLIYQHVRVTLDKFVYDKNTDRIGVQLIITKNPVIELFFAFYAILILLMIWYFIIRLNQSILVY